MAPVADARLRCSGRLVISRRRFLTGAAIALAPMGAAAHAQEYKAQQAGKLPRIGFLGSTYAGPSLDAFRQVLRELGWVEGQNIVIDYRFPEGRVDRLTDLAVELVRLKVDIIVAEATQGVAAAKNATGTN